MEKAIIYTRVSTEEQGSKGYSLRDQKEKLEFYCMNKGIEIVGHFEDDCSAKTFIRPGFKNFLLFTDILFFWDKLTRRTF